MELNRRNFLKQTAAAGVLAMGAGTILGACGGSIKRADLAAVEKNVTSVPDLDACRIRILYYASLAPSGHNAQPWFVKIKSLNNWIVGIHPERVLPAVDPNNRNALLSIGAFVENLSVAAGVLGFETKVKIIANDPFDKEILKITLRESNKIEYPGERITKRMTVKNGYIQNEIKSNDIRILSKGLKGRLHYFPRGNEHAKCIQEETIEAFRIQTNRDKAQAELVKWMRLENNVAEKYRDGITVAGMDIQGIKGWFVRNFLNPEDFMKPSFRKQGIDHIAKLALQGGGWLIITGKGHGVADLIETGRKFEQMALMAREHMIGIHPMTMCLEEKSGQKKIAENHHSSMIPHFILRVSYLKKYPDPVSLRRPVSWFVS